MVRKRTRKSGKLNANGVRFRLHEKLTVDFFLDRGDDVDLLVPSYTAGNKTADLMLWGKVWEAKSPETCNSNTIIVMLKRAARQSCNLIIDLRRVKSNREKVLKLIEVKFFASKKLERMLIIYDGELIEFKKH